VPQTPVNTHWHQRVIKYFQTYLFKLKDVLVKVVLQALVGKVNTELFETIIFIVFKPKNIEYSNG